MNLNLKRLKDLSEKQLLIISISFIALVVIVMGVIIYLGYSQESQYLEEKKTYEDAAAKNKKIIDKKLEFEATIAKGKKFMERYKELIVSEEAIKKQEIKDYKDVRVFISEAAQKATELTKTSVRIEKAEQKPEKKKTAANKKVKVEPPFKEEAWEFEIMAKAPGLVAFLNELERLPKAFVEIRSLKVKASAPKLTKDKSKLEYPEHKISIELVAHQAVKSDLSEDKELEKLHEALFKDAAAAMSNNYYNFPDPDEMLKKTSVVAEKVKNDPNFIGWLFRPVVVKPISINSLESFEMVIAKLEQKKEDYTKGKTVVTPVQWENDIKEAGKLRDDIAAAAQKENMAPADKTKFDEVNKRLDDLAAWMPSGEVIGPKSTVRMEPDKDRSKVFNEIADIWVSKKYDDAIAAKDKDLVKDAKGLVEQYLAEEKATLMQEDEVTKLKELASICANIMDNVVVPIEDIMSKTALEMKTDADEALSSDDMDVVKEGKQAFEAAKFFNEPDLTSAVDKAFLAKYTKLFDDRIRDIIVDNLTGEYSNIIASILKLEADREYEKALNEGRHTRSKLETVFKDSKGLNDKVIQKLHGIYKEINDLITRIEQKWAREVSFTAMLNQIKPIAIIKLNDKFSVMLPYEWKKNELETRDYKWFDNGSVIELVIDKKTKASIPKNVDIKEGYILRVKIIDVTPQDVTFQHMDQEDLKKTIKLMPDFGKEGKKK